MNHHFPAMDVLNNKNIYSKSSIQSLFISLLVAVAITACGSGGGGGSSPTNTATSAVISGNAMAGPIANGIVTAYTVTSSGSKDAVLGTTTTDVNGAYSLTLNYTGAVFLEVTGGSYVDEATGQTVNVPTTLGSGLQAVVSNVTASGGMLAQITPLTTMAAARAQAMTGGLTIANINAANQEVGLHFGSIDILSTQPINPLVTNSVAGATQDAINYGLILAGLSKEAQTLGLANPLDLVTALAQDFSDGSFDGKAGPTPVQLNGSAMDPATGTTGLGMAIIAFSADTSHNVSGGTVPPALIAFIDNNIVPNLAGFTLSAADAVITSAGLTGGSVTQTSSTTVAAGDVISQSPTAGTSVGLGTVINLTVSSGSGGSQATETVLYSFGSWADGSQPHADLIQGTDGNFYGTTLTGGTNGTGTVFKITPAGVETVLHSFGGGTDGNGSSGGIPGLIQGTDGNFYGTTNRGGTNDTGTVFKITSAGVEAVLHSFGPYGSGADGISPEASLIQGADGNFYGTTSYGGTYNLGTVFKITPTGVETVLYSFGGGTDGANPYAGLIQGTDGNIYGTTSFGGTNNRGTVFKITSAGVEAVLYSFGASSTDGAYPQAALIQGTDGDFYGTTAYGGTNYWGTVFKITPAGVETVLYSFFGSGTYGMQPRAGLVQGTDGNFYGTTECGGTYVGSYNGYGSCARGGTVFKITPAGVETVLHSFGGGTDGSVLWSGLIQGTDGNIYGTTSFGGTNNRGTVFKITP